MLGAHVLVPQALRFFRREIENALAFLAQRHFHRCGNALANRDSRLDLLADRFD